MQTVVLVECALVALGGALANLTTSTQHVMLHHLLVRGELHRRHLQTVALPGDGGRARLLLRDVVAAGRPVLLVRWVVGPTLNTAVVLPGRQQVDFLAMEAFDRANASIDDTTLAHYVPHGVGAVDIR